MAKLTVLPPGIPRHCYLCVNREIARTARCLRADPTDAALGVDRQQRTCDGERTRKALPQGWPVAAPLCGRNGDLFELHPDVKV